jgi:transposase
VLTNIESILEQTELLQRFINECELKISEGVAQVPYSHLITKIKGIGILTAAVIISEVGDFRKFTRYEELEKLAGLNLYEISSGIRKGQKRISKRGRHLLRAYLFFASLRMIRKNGIFYDKYQEYRKRGMPGTKAIVAISRKLLRLIFAIVRDHKEFNQDQLKTSALLKAA